MAPAAKRVGSYPIPAEKRPKTDTVHKGLMEALQQGQGLSEGCRNMLLASVPWVFQIPEGGRHAHQDSIISMIAEVLEAGRVKLQEELDSESGKTAGVETQQATLLASVTEAQSTLAASKEAKEAKSTALVERTSELNAAEAHLKEATRAQFVGDASLTQAKASKDELDSALSDHFAPLKEEAAFEDVAAVKAHIKALGALAKKISCDDSLLTSIPSSGGKKPSERGGFDAMVVDQMEASLKGAVAKLETELAEGAPASADRAAAVSQATSKLEGARAAAQQAAEELAAADEAVVNAQNALKLAEDAVKAFKAEYDSAMKAKEDKEVEVNNWKDYHTLCFNCLREGPKSTPAAESA